MTVSTKKFAILGAGLQGTCAAYDLARSAAPAEIRFLDASSDAAGRAAARLRELVGYEASHAAVNALDPLALTAALEGIDVLLSCVPFWMHPEVEKTALCAGVSVCDLGGNTEIAKKTLALDGIAKENDATVVPDCGLAPGLVVSLGLALHEKLGDGASISLFCGVLPEHPIPPLGYKLTFNVEGLVTEYDGRAQVLRSGEIVEVDTLTELESVATPIGELEAFVTSGGLSTAPDSLRGRLRSLSYKTLRYPGHGAIVRAFKETGFWSRDEVEVSGGLRVRPLDVFHKVFGDAMARIVDTEVCVVMARGVGADGREASLTIVDRTCPKTGFTAMQRLTGFSLAIVAEEVAAGRVGPGAVRYEHAMTGTRFVERLRERGIEVLEG